MKILQQVDQFVTKLEEFLLSYAVLLMAVVLIGNVISRTIINRSWTFAEEVGQSLVIITTFVGISYAARKARHISMSTLIDIMPEKMRKVSVMIISFITSLALFYIGYLALEYTLKVQQLGRVSPALRIPMYLIIAFVPLGFFLGGLQYARTFVKNIREQEVYVSIEKTYDSCDL